MKNVLTVLSILFVFNISVAQEGYQKKTKKSKADQAFLVQNYYDAAAFTRKLI